MNFRSLVCDVHLMIVIEVELRSAIGRYDLEGFAIGGEELAEIIARHPAAAMPIRGVDPNADPEFRFEFLEEPSLSPPAPSTWGLANQSRPKSRTVFTLVMVVCKLTIFYRMWCAVDST